MVQADIVAGSTKSVQQNCPTLSSDGMSPLLEDVPITVRWVESSIYLNVESSIYLNVDAEQSEGRSHGGLRIVRRMLGLSA